MKSINSFTDPNLLYYNKENSIGKNIFFPEARIPVISEIAKTVIVTLSAHSVVMLSVSKAWYLFIKNDKDLYRDVLLIPNCINQSKRSLLKIDIWYQISKAYCEMTSVEFQNTHNLLQALQAIEINEKIFHKYEAFYRFSIIEARSGNFSQAIEIAKKINDDSYLSLRPNEKAFLEIAKITALFDLNLAEECIKNLKDPCTKVEAYVELAKLDSKRYLSSCFDFAQEIQGPSKKILAYLKIAEIDLARGLFEAKLVAQNEAQSPCDLCFSLIEIAKIDPAHDYTRAVQIAETLDEIPKLNAVIRIAEYDSKHSFARAKEIAQRRKIYSPSDGFFSVVVHEVLFDPEQAKLTIKHISDPELYSKALLEIVKVEIHSNLAQAKLMVKQIKVPIVQSEAVFEIVKVEVQLDLISAIQTADSIEHPYYRCLAFCEIAKVAISTKKIAAY